MAAANTSKLRKRYGYAAAQGVIFEQDDDWWVASIPGVPGAYSQGRTKGAAYRNLLDAMAEAEKAGLGPR